VVTNCEYVFRAHTKGSPGARDLSRRNTATANQRLGISRPLRFPTVLRTEVRAPFARAATALNRYNCDHLPGLKFSLPFDNHAVRILVMNPKRSVISHVPFEERIQTIRGEKIILDADLAELYGVSTKRLNQQIKRNAERFPSDFAFLLTESEKVEVVANCDHLSRLKFSSALNRRLT